MNRLDANEMRQRTPREKTRGMRAASALMVSFNQRTEAGSSPLRVRAQNKIRD